MPYLFLIGISMNNDTQEFVQQWYKDKPVNDFILLWTIDHAGKKQSYWYQDCSEIPNAVSLMPTRNVYVGMGTSANDYGEKLRAKENQIIGIPGLWCDIDYGNEGHAKTNNPPSEVDAMSLLINDMPLQPTMIVSSGHGLHAYWQFDVWYPIAFDADRMAAKTLETRWQSLLADYAKARGWQLDSVNDLARVLRIPGSLNNKTNDPIACNLEAVYPKFRYSIATIEAAIPASIPTVAKPIRSINTSNRISPVGNIVIPIDTPKLDHERMSRLLEIKNFVRTFDHKQTNFKDTSDSAYEMSLLNYALADGWSDQEAVNLCIYWRRKHELSVGKHPVSYYLTSLQNVHNDILAGIADENTIKTLKQTAKNSKTTEMTGEERATRLQYLRDALEIPITRVVVVISDPHLWSIETELGNVELGEIANLTSYVKCNNRILDMIGLRLPPKIKKSWDDVSKLISDIRIEVEMQDATNIGTMQSWLADYFRDKAIEDIDISSVFDYGTPVITPLGAYIKLDDFIDYVDVKKAKGQPRNQICSWLRACNGANKKIHHPKDNKTVRHLWVVPLF